MILTWPKERRLTCRAQYTACYDRGSRHYTRYFVVFALGEDASSGDRSCSEGRTANGLADVPTQEAGRLGLAVTRKCGNAVERNRIKRVLREFFRLHQYSMPAMDIVVTPKRHLRADKISLALVERDLVPLLDALRVKAAARVSIKASANASADASAHVSGLGSGKQAASGPSPEKGAIQTVAEQNATEQCPGGDA